MQSEASQSPRSRRLYDTQSAQERRFQIALQSATESHSLVGVCFAKVYDVIESTVALNSHPAVVLRLIHRKLLSALRTLHYSPRRMQKAIAKRGRLGDGEGH